MTQHITAAEAYANAKLAYEAGTLQAQVTTGIPRYRDVDVGCSCAIGVSLSDETLNAIEAADYSFLIVAGLVSGGLLTTDNVCALSDLQNMHDGWLLASVKENLVGKPSKDFAEARFKTLLERGPE